MTLMTTAWIREGEGEGGMVKLVGERWLDYRQSIAVSKTTLLGKILPLQLENIDISIDFINLFDYNVKNNVSTASFKRKKNPTVLRNGDNEVWR